MIKIFNLVDNVVV